ncbi:EFR1 family ferrodoxin [Paenibacillus sanguinis]|uniref:EFR1 family ferrodoxin n=1 Tax=Paenibacillus sanguinis TaxID=225906 RepID=UPI00037F80D7|nr:EFR1 family ferrodoxin [Paenibacillus sanguinis]
MIIYFSGTGNSLSMAKLLSRLLNEPILHINAALQRYSKMDEAKIGIIFPVYCCDIPDPVAHFVEKMEFNPSAYIYGIATCGGDAGNALYSLSKLLTKKNLKLSYGREITMTDNCTPLISPPTVYYGSSISNQKNLAEQIASDISQNRIDTSTISYGLKNTLTHAAISGFVLDKLLKKSVNYDLCVHCGTCQKICPQNNIKIEAGKIEFGKACVQCLACVHWCPNAAIQLRGRTLSKSEQYHHPEITLKEMLKHNAP